MRVSATRTTSELLLTTMAARHKADLAAQIILLVCLTSEEATCHPSGEMAVVECLRLGEAACRPLVAEVEAVAVVECPHLEEAACHPSEVEALLAIAPLEADEAEDPREGVHLEEVEGPQAAAPPVEAACRAVEALAALAVVRMTD